MDVMDIVWNWISTNSLVTAELFTALILLIALIVAWRGLNAGSRDRKSSIAMNVCQYYDSVLLLEGRKIFLRIKNWQAEQGIQNSDENFLKTVEYYKYNFPDEFTKLRSLLSFFEIVGWLARRKFCNPKDIHEQIGWEEPWYYWKPFIRKAQKKEEEEQLDSKPTALYGLCLVGK